MDVHPPPQEGTDTMTTDQDPGVLRAQARARARAAGQLRDRLRDFNALSGRLVHPNVWGGVELDADALIRLAAELRDLSRLADEVERAAVTLAKDSGATWQAIADGLGMPNRQNAQAKYAPRGAGR